MGWVREGREKTFGAGYGFFPPLLHCNSRIYIERDGGGGLFGGDVRAFFRGRSSHEEYRKYQEDRHDGGDPEYVEIGEGGCLRIADLLQD